MSGTLGTPGRDGAGGQQSQLAKAQQVAYEAMLPIRNRLLEPNLLYAILHKCPSLQVLDLTGCLSGNMVRSLCHLIRVHPLLKALLIDEAHIEVDDLVRVLSHCCFHNVSR